MDSKEEDKQNNQQEKLAKASINPDNNKKISLEKRRNISNYE